jgi:thioredoxin 1
MIVNINSLDELYINDSDYPIIINFTATWCKPCSAIAPLIENLDKEIKVKIFKVDIDKFQEYVEKMGINSIPTFYVYKQKGQPIVVNGSGESIIQKIKEVIQ